MTRSPMTVFILPNPNPNFNPDRTSWNVAYNSPKPILNQRWSLSPTKGEASDADMSKDEAFDADMSNSVSHVIVKVTGDELDQVSDFLL